MKTLLTTVALSALIVASPAHSDDWSGAYAGIIGSYSDNNLTASLLDYNGQAVAGTQDSNLNGGLFGVQAGYGKQIGQFYIGVETDWQFGDLDQSIANGGGLLTTYSMDQMGTLRGRLGFIVGQFMPYVTGGVAISHGTIGAYFDPISVQASSWDVGYVAGGGLEWRPVEHWALKVEGLYSDFGTHSLASATDGVDTIDLVSVKNDGAQVRFSAAYKF